MAMNLSRRGLIAGMGALLAAPAIVRASSLDPLSFRKFESAPDLMRDWFPPQPVAGEQIYEGDLVYIGNDQKVYRLATPHVDTLDYDRILASPFGAAKGEEVGLATMVRVLW